MILYYFGIFFFLSRSVMSNSLRPCGHQAPLSMDFLGKSTGVDCHFLLQSTLGSDLGQGTRSHMLQLRSRMLQWRWKILCALTKIQCSQIHKNKYWKRKSYLFVEDMGRIMFIDIMCLVCYLACSKDFINVHWYKNQNWEAGVLATGPPGKSQ